jgi:uncharacterized protein (DUF2252 family)
MSRNIIARVHRFNQGRDPSGLRLKFEKMRGDRFAFFRGTCHLFYEDWPSDSCLNSAPAAWSCGDLHLENFGSFKGDDRQVYFDINDFDEGILAPCTWDLARLLTSVWVATQTLALDQAEADQLCQIGLQTYVAMLIEGKARLIDLDTADGMVRDLLVDLKQRKRKEFLDKRTVLENDRRTLLLDDERVVAVSAQERSQIATFLEDWAAAQPDPQFFQLLDVAHRYSGNSSLGLRRYLLLIEGKGSPDKNYLLDLKQTLPSALHPFTPLAQPTWESEADRVVTIQTRFQAIDPAILHAVTIDQTAFVLRELQPTQDKLKLELWDGRLGRLETVTQTMAAITAWGQLRSSGRQGSAIADDLIALAHEQAWQQDLLQYAQAYAAQVEADYQEFCQAA